MEHTADACDLLQSKIRNDLYRNRSSTIIFPNKFRNNADLLIIPSSNSDNSHYFLITSFNMPWLKYKSSNCWIFWLSCEDRKHFN